MAKRYTASVDRTQYLVLLPGPPLVVVYVVLVCIHKSNLSPDTAQSGNNQTVVNFSLGGSALPSVLAQRDSMLYSKRSQ